MFERFELLVGREKLNIIAEKTVLIVGLGGVGGYAATSLVRSGISNVIIIDFDIVDITNINRQVIAYQSTIGKKKVDIMSAMLLDINPNVNIIKYDLFLKPDNINEIFSRHKIDYIVDACDFISTKKSIIEYSLINDIKVISCMGTGNRFDPTKIKIMDIKETNNDPVARIIRKWARDNKISKKIPVLCSTEVPMKNGKLVGSNSFVPPAAGIVIASHIIRDIIK